MWTPRPGTVCACPPRLPTHRPSPATRTRSTPSPGAAAARPVACAATSTCCATSATSRAGRGGGPTRSPARCRASRAGSRWPRTPTTRWPGRWRRTPRSSATRRRGPGAPTTSCRCSAGGTWPTASRSPTPSSTRTPTPRGAAGWSSACRRSRTSAAGWRRSPTTRRWQRAAQPAGSARRPTRPRSPPGSSSAWSTARATGSRRTRTCSARSRSSCAASRRSRARSPSCRR